MRPRRLRQPLQWIPRTEGGRQERWFHKRPFLLEMQMLSIFRRLMKNERGASAIEYALIASLIAVAAITAMTSVGKSISNVMSNVAGNLT